MTEPTPTNADGRNPAWPADSVAVGLWEAVLASTEVLSAADVGRLRLALDTLHDAEALRDRAQSMSDRDAIAAYAGARAARKAASDLVAELTGAKRGPGRPPKEGPTHGHRPQGRSTVRKEGSEIESERRWNWNLAPQAQAGLG